MKTLRVYGDSFAAIVNDTPRDWPTMLSEKLGIPLVGKGVHGGSTEYAALQIFNDFHNNVIGDDDVVIYVPSIKGRLHFDLQMTERPESAAGYQFGPNPLPNADNTWYHKSKSHIEWWITNRSEDLLTMNFESYVHLISNIARSKPNSTFVMIKHIDWGNNISGFRHPENFLIPSIEFTKITSHEIIGGYEYKSFVQYTTYDPRANHLTVPNLLILTDLLYDAINKKDVSGITLDKFKTNLIEKITSKQQYLDYVDQGLLDYSKYIVYHLRNL
jgi:hypothetical protein